MSGRVWKYYNSKDHTKLPPWQFFWKFLKIISSENDILRKFSGTKGVILHHFLILILRVGYVYHSKAFYLLITLSVSKLKFDTFVRVILHIFRVFLLLNRNNHQLNSFFPLITIKASKCVIWNLIGSYYTFSVDVGVKYLKSYFQ